jgi:hypothetical protein
MKRALRGVFFGVLWAPVLSFAAGTVAEYSRTLPPDYRQSNQRFNHYPGSLLRPGIAWADPYALGRLRLLIVLPWNAAHESAELRSRIPADISLITMAAGDKWVNPQAGELAYEPVPPDGVALTDTARRLLSPGYRYDAILIGKVAWSAIPAEIQGRILEKVRGGTALVWISPWDVPAELRQEMALSEADNALARAVRAAVPLSLLPLDVDCEQTAPKSYYPRRIGPPDFRCGKLGGGNVVWLDYQDRTVKPQHAEDRRTVCNVTPWTYYAEGLALTPFLPYDELHYEYYFSILGKALYQAAGKTTAVQLSAVEPGVSVARQALPAAPVAFAVGLPGADLRDTSFTYEVRDRQGRVVQTGAGALPPGTRQFSPPLARLPRGTYVVDLWALQRGAVLDWASAALVVTDTQYLDAVVPAQEYFARSESIRGRVAFATPPGRGRSTRVELWDTYERLVAVTTLTRDAEFAFPPVAHPFSRAYRVVVKVMEKDVAVDRAETWVGLPANTVDDYQFFMWANAIRTRANRTLMHLCREFAVTGYYDGALYYPQREQLLESAAALAQNNLLANPYSMHAVLRLTPQASLQQTVTGLTDWLQARLEAYRRYGVMAYSTCEECYIDRTEGSWDNPEALRDYHVFLQERYGDVARLNEIWSSAFKGFGEITPISLTEAKSSRQPTRWLEQERHKVERFNRLYETIYEHIQKADPGARMSLDCTGGMDYDWPRMAKIATAGTQASLEAFSKDRGNLVGTWIGYYINENNEWTMRTTPWRYLFQGGTHVHWWPAAYAFTADLCEPMLCLQQAAEECRELQSGAGKLLLSSQKRLDPILLLWSNDSYYAGILHPGEISWESARQRFDNLLRHTGFDYQAVGTEFLEHDLAYGDRQRVLILPASQSVSRRGVAQVKAFVEAGGVAVADFPPAVVDEYLRPYGTPEAPGQVEFETCARCKGQKRLEVDHVWQACPACGGAGQTMKGDVAPSHSLLDEVFDFAQQGARHVGKGYGLFLKGSPVRQEEWGAIRKALVEHAGVHGDIEVQDPLGNLRTDIRSYVFDNGRARFLGLLPDRALDNPPAEALVVRLTAPTHVYDVRRQQYLGETAAVRTGILPAEAKLLAFLPERIEGLNLSLSRDSARPGDVLTLAGALLPATLQDCRLVVRIEVTRDGRREEAYTRNVAFQGTFSYPIPLALNQTKGEYVVRATDVISGNTRELPFRVK